MSAPAPRPPYSLWRVFRWPLALAAASLAGLTAALLGDGWLNMLSWLCLGGVVAVTVLLWRR